MYTIDFSKHKNVPASENFVQYLILPSEPKETVGPIMGRQSFGFRNRYLAKRQIMRTIRRIRRAQT